MEKSSGRAEQIRIWDREIYPITFFSYRRIFMEKKYKGFKGSGYNKQKDSKHSKEIARLADKIAHNMCRSLGIKHEYRSSDLY